MTTFRRAIAVGAAMVLAAGLTIFYAPAATAGRAAVVFECYGYWVPPGKKFTYTITITAPATASRGATVTLGASIESSPATGDPGSTPSSASMRIALGGAASGEVIAYNFVIPHGTTNYVNGTATATLPNAGTVTFGPRGWSVPGFTCYTVEPIPVLATTQVR